MLSIGIIAGLVAMFCWGIADFIQAVLAKKLGTPKTVLISNSIGMVVNIAMILVFFSLGYGYVLNRVESSILIFACLLQAVASFAFITAFEKGEVSIVAPLSGTYSLVTVLLAVFILGEVLTLYKIISIIFIILGIVLVSTDFSKLKNLHTVNGVKEVLVAVLLWGVYFFLLAYIKDMYLLRAGVESSKLILGMNIYLMTSLFGGIFSILIALMLKAAIKREDIKSNTAVLFFANLILYTAAWIAVNVGLVTELVSLLAPVSSLYPAITVLLAAIVLKEKLVKNQYIGLVTILAGIFLLGF